MRKFFILFFCIVIFGCEEDTLPKPKAFLSLEYPSKSYKSLEIDRPFSFDILETTLVKDERNNWLKIKYPALKASIDITYREVDNNLNELLTEAEKLVFKHTIKAEEIKVKDFTFKEKNMYGSLYEITGNAASHLQFHATDSTQNFIKGSLYFYTKPNYDSILPAVTYIKKDVLRLMESLEWKK